MNTASLVSSQPATLQELASSGFKASLASRLLGLTPILARYKELPLSADPADFATRALDEMGIRVRTQGLDLEDLPSSGPLLLAANHPFGALEGLILAKMFTRVRPDLKILANHMLCRVPELRDLVIPVNVLNRKAGRTANISGLRSALRHLESGGALAVFPSGVVSHWQARQRRVTDPVWNALAGRLARAPETAVVPLYFAGRNSLLFQAAGCMHPMLRTALLPRELWRMRGRDIDLRVGDILEGDVLSSLADDEGRTAYIRARCYALGRIRRQSVKTWPVPVAEAEDAQELQKEIERLAPSVLAETEKFRVFSFKGSEGPRLLREIGRLREKTFRTVQEGSGKALDLDRFDKDYIHLVLWDKQTEGIAGSYRVRIFSPDETRKAGKKLYTASLFNFAPDFFSSCGLSMELGRAFIREEYQRDYAPLHLLWKGIAALAFKNKVSALFGPCSIGLDYSPESRLMLRRCLEELHSAPELASSVQGRCAPEAFPGPNEPHARGLEYKLLNRAVKGLEGGKGLPILFKHYLQLGGRIAAFHKDNSFGTLDALMVVRMNDIPAKTLARYM